jgi:hypothetical protein
MTTCLPVWDHRVISPGRLSTRGVKKKMTDFSDYELQRTSNQSSLSGRTPAHPIGLWIAIALLMAAAGVAAYVLLGRRALPAPVATGAPPAAKESAARSLGGEAEPIAVPPLDESDAVVRQLVGALSESPAIAAWLATDGLIRNFTVVVVNIAEGVTPARHLKTLRPASTFRVVDRDGGTLVDARSYERYDAVANAVASVDAVAAARLYATLKPRIEEAYRELGYSDTFDRTLERAIVTLLKTPIVDGPVRMRPKGIGYAYVDPRLEQLTAAQKQLLRMGPRNARIVEERLRAIALALGVPASALPPER